MKNIGFVITAVLFLIFSDALFSDEKLTKSLKHEELMFSVLLSSVGTARCPSSQSIKLINSQSELRNSFHYLYACASNTDYKIRPPSIDFKKGSAILLDMGSQHSLGHRIEAMRMLKQNSKFHLTFVTVEPGQGCWVPQQMQRPFQLIYFKEKIDSLDMHHVRRIEACDD